MSNPYFRFKQFTVWHDQCAMKVGTDGCLLGAWADVGKVRRHILDVGTGSGLIALMLAQRREAVIDAIDIDLDACRQARSNIAKSPFPHRLQVYHASLSDYRPEEGRRYDLIVSNPPYFEESLKCPENKRNVARHTDTLALPDLLRDSLRCLAPNGSIALILPFSRRDSLLAYAREASLSPSKETHVSSLSGAPPKRLLIELSTQPTAHPILTTLTIETREHQYTAEFINLMRDFYLKI